MGSSQSRTMLEPPLFWSDDAVNVHYLVPVELDGQIESPRRDSTWKSCRMFDAFRSAHMSLQRGQSK